MTAGPATLPRLLLGVGDESTVGLEGHIELHGPLPDLRRTSSGQLIELAASAGLRGRGGTSFPDPGIRPSDPLLKGIYPADHPGVPPARSSAGWGSSALLS